MFVQISVDNESTYEQAAARSVIHSVWAVREFIGGRLPINISYTIIYLPWSGLSVLARDYTEQLYVVDKYPYYFRDSEQPELPLLIDLHLQFSQPLPLSGHCWREWSNDAWSDKNGYCQSYTADIPPMQNRCMCYIWPTHLYQWTLFFQLVARPSCRCWNAFIYLRSKKCMRSAEGLKLRTYSGWPSHSRWRTLTRQFTPKVVPQLSSICYSTAYPHCYPLLLSCLHFAYHQI